MLKNVLNTLKENGYNEIVYTFGIEESIREEEKRYINEKLSVNKVNDARSATFYALGKENLHNNCIVLINGDEIQNILTAITETWFQKLNIVIIALYKKYDDIKTDFLRRAIPNIVNIYEEDYKAYETSIIKATKAYSPTLITIKYNLMLPDYNYNNLTKKLNKFLKQDDEVFLYSINENTERCNFKIRDINEKYKYCIVSKYMGYIVGCKRKTLLCMPAKLLLLDLNILNNRYIDKNLKIILFNYNELGKETLLKDWCNCNKIKTIEADNILEKQLEEFWNEEEPTLLLLKGEM